MSTRMKNFRWKVALCALFIAGAAWAADLAGSKASGAIGEREDGYLGFVGGSAAPDVVALVESVNDKRRAEYARIAASNGLTRQQVEALAGKKAIAKTAPGGYVFQGGQWVKK